MRCKELALLTGRAMQSEETRFVHYCYHSNSRDPIPLRENLCFVLALLRSRIADNIQEAKELLERLLSYQTGGNFPIYLHEFPKCYDRYRSAEILPSLIWILRGFHHVLGNGLKEKLENSIREAVSHCLSMLEIRQADERILLRIGTSLLAAGRYFENAKWCESGINLVSQIEALGIQPSWFVSEELGHRLASLSQIDVWPLLWQHCEEMYHKKFNVYCGPHLSEKQWQEAPEPNLFSLYMGDSGFQDSLHPSYLLGALVHPFERPGPVEKPLKGPLAGNSWEVCKNESWALSLLDQVEALDPAQDKLFSPVYLIWENNGKPQSLVAQGGNAKQISYSRDGKQIELHFTLGNESENDHPKDRVEAAFFCSRKDTGMTVEGKKATLFRLEESVQVDSPVPVSIHFSLVQGEGDFTGHISLGNRPSQTHSEGDALDWKIAIRSVRRTPDCVLKAKLSIDV